MKIITKLSSGDCNESKEIYFIAYPEELRRISRFFEHCANGIENSNQIFGHAHLQDFERYGSARFPDIIIAQEE